MGIDACKRGRTKFDPSTSGELSRIPDARAAAAEWMHRFLAHLAKIDQKIIIDQKINMYIYIIKKNINNEHQLAQGAKAHA